MHNKKQIFVVACVGIPIASIIAWLLTELGAPAAGAVLLAFALVGSIGAVLYFTLLQKQRHLFAVDIHVLTSKRSP